MIDLINGAFELSGAWFVALSIRRVLRDRIVQGVDWRTTAFFGTWGLWNLFFYPSLEQWWSFVGGVAVCATNLWYMVLLIKYNRVRALSLVRLKARRVGVKYYGPELLREPPEDIQ